MATQRTESEIEKKYGVEHNSNELGYNSNGQIANPGGNKPDLVGYSNVTAGIQGFYHNRSGNSAGIQNFDPDVFAAKEVFRMGRMLVKIMKFPAFFPPLACEIARWLFEDQVRGFDGVPENSIGSIDIEIGPTGIPISYPGMYKQTGKDFSLKVMEWKGRPLGKFIEWWLGGLADRSTNVGHLYGKNMNYVRPNYGMTFLYVILGPKASPDDIEFACLYHEAYPTKEIAGYLSSNTLGDAGSVGEQDVPFTGIYDTSPEVDLLAQIVTAQVGLYNESYLDNILPSYFYKEGGLLAGDTTRLAELQPKMSINNIDRLKITQEQKVNGYDADVMAKIDELRERAYGPAGSSIKEAYTYESAIQRAMLSVQERTTVQPS